MEEILNFDSILGIDEIDNLFLDKENEQAPPPDNEEEKQKEDNNKETTEVDADTLFKPEGVGSEEEDKDKEDAASEKGKGSSPNNNFYSSIAKALYEEGILPDLNSEITDNIKSPEDFAEAIEKQIQSKFDERQRRIDSALNVGVEPTEISKYERTLNYLDSITDDVISDESDKGEILRKQLIYQDFINRGYSKERATREVEKSFNSGSDLEDAKEALQSNKDYFNGEYDSLVKEAQKEVEKEKKRIKEESESLRKSILEGKDIIGNLNLDQKTRQKIYDNISKPVYKDPNTGEYYTTLQKYQTENKAEFIKNLGVIFTLTNGFKDLDGLIKPKVKKEIKKGLRELEHTINNTSRTPEGGLKFVSGVSEDPESFSKGWSLDI